MHRIRGAPASSPIVPTLRAECTEIARRRLADTRHSRCRVIPAITAIVEARQQGSSSLMRRTSAMGNGISARRVSFGRVYGHGRLGYRRARQRSERETLKLCSHFFATRLHALLMSCSPTWRVTSVINSPYEEVCLGKGTRARFEIRPRVKLGSRVGH